ncbi:MAG: hypothetical protein K6A43_09055 [Treponema sp.]|nr:hypothetical protein [Treponema sp.]
MGREIELKIPVSETEYKRLFEFMKGFDKIEGIRIGLGSLDRIIKNDEYYSRYQTRQESKAAGEPQVIRIRTETYGTIGQIVPGYNYSPDKISEHAFFCIKRKVIENGIELNREDETFVQNADVIRDILTLSGYHKFFDKKKDALSVLCYFEGRAYIKPECAFHVELEIVNDFKYVEIEVTDEGNPADEVRADLEKFVAMLGLDVTKRDSRSWMEILNAAKK